MMMKMTVLSTNIDINLDAQALDAAWQSQVRFCFLFLDIDDVGE